MIPVREVLQGLQWVQGKALMETETQKMPENSFQQKLHYISINLKGTVNQIILKQTYDYFKTNNAEMLAFITVLVFKSLSCKVLFIKRKDNKNC